jgi:hypothetical protein
MSLGPWRQGLDTVVRACVHEQGQRARGGPRRQPGLADDPPGDRPPSHTLHEVTESAPHRPGSGSPGGTGSCRSAGNGGRNLRFPKTRRVLTVLHLRLLHLVSSYGSQCSRADAYGSKTSRLVIAPISGGSLTRLLPYSTRCFTAVSLPTDGGSTGHDPRGHLRVPAPARSPADRSAAALPPARNAR